ncbi:MAG: TIR domain-containing protein [Oscillatoria sp. SIO1A7]|nr:TIR domain-containing protein [Oscillatoria sp. SIO1A7]
MVAQSFLKDFLTAFSRGASLYLSVREAREKLQGLEREHPCASLLPVICQNSAELPPTWTELGGKRSLLGQKVFISYCEGETERSLGNEFARALREAGQEALRAEEIVGLGENWPKRVEEELQKCDYLLLLLSERSATSEVTTKEIERAKELRESRPGGKPAILPIRVNFPPSSPLNYEQRGYLDRIGQRQWNGDEDTPAVLAEILKAVATGEMPNIEASSRLEEPATIAEDSAPLPVAEPELPEGQMELASRFYVERPPIESSCYETILNPGALIRIKAPRQMGKTSLLARIIQQGELEGYRTVSLNLQLTDRQILSRLDGFLKWLCASASQKLNLPEKLDDYWSVILGNNTSCTTYFERYLLANTDSPIVLALDEIDRVFEYREVADDFFALLRAWHEEAKNNAIWKKLRLAIAHSTEVYIPVNINQSPFNVGLAIELPEFRPEQVEDLAGRHRLSWGQSQVEQLMHLVGGHPFLVRVALYRIARQDITLEALLKTAATDASLYGDHLRRHWWNLQQNPELAEAFARVVSAREPVRLEPLQGFKLNSMGLVNLQNEGATPRCDLYRQYFQGIAASS